jgi:hypothetical protein
MPPFGKVSRRWSLACLFLVVCAGLTILAIDSELNRRGPFWNKYQQVQPGMTKQQVEAILGPPTDEDFGSGLGNYNYVGIWQDGNQTMYVHFWRDRAYEKSFYPKAVWDRFMPENLRKKQWGR